MTRIQTLLALAFALLASAATAQTNLTVGGLNADPEAPVEVTADNLSVDQDSGQAVFEGNVVIGQGDLRIAAARVLVVYNDDSGDIARLEASGGVTFVTETEAAEAQSAVYDLDSGTLTMSGQVLLTQGATAVSADRMDVNLESGTARMSGNVKTVFQQQGGN